MKDKCQRLKDSGETSLWKCGKVDIAVYKSKKTGLWAINVDNFVFKNTIPTKKKAVQEVKIALRNRK